MTDEGDGLGEPPVTHTRATGRDRRPTDSVLAWGPGTQEARA